MAWTKLNDEEKRFLEATQRVRNKFANGKIKANEFEMATYSTTSCSVSWRTPCKTLHCIGGWIGVELGLSGEYNPAADFSGLRDDIKIAANRLFNPPEGDGWRSKKREAIKAIDNFLAGHKQPWRGVFANKE